MDVLEHGLLARDDEMDGRVPPGEVALDPPEKDEADEGEDRRQGRDEEVPRPGGKADRHDHPDRRRGGEPPDVEARLDDRPRAQEADPGDHLGGEPRGVAVREGASEAVDGHEHDEAAPDGDEKMRTEPGGMPVELALEADEEAEEDRHEDRKEDKEEIPGLGIGRSLEAAVEPIDDDLVDRGHSRSFLEKALCHEKRPEAVALGVVLPFPGPIIREEESLVLLLEDGVLDPEAQDVHPAAEGAIGRKDPFPVALRNGAVQFLEPEVERAQRVRAPEVVEKGREHPLLEYRGHLLRGDAQPLEEDRGALPRVPELLHLLPRLPDGLGGEGDGRAVVAPEHHEAEGKSSVVLDHVLHEDDVPEGLRHLLPADVDEAVMHPVARQGVPVMGPRLGDLVLMMRELQVEAAPVDVDEAPLAAEDRVDHHAALGVPSGPPHPPGGFPANPFLGPFPEGEVERVLLLLPRGDAGPAFEILDGVSGKLAVMGDVPDPQVDVPIPHVGGALLHQILDVADDLSHHLRGTGGQGRLHRPDFLDEAAVLLDDGIGKLALRDAELLGPADDLVVDVGVVADRGHLAADRLQHPPEEVEDDDGAEVPDVGVGVDGGTAEIKGGLPFLERDELLLLPRERVMEI